MQFTVLELHFYAVLCQHVRVPSHVARILASYLTFATSGEVDGNVTGVKQQAIVCAFDTNQKGMLGEGRN